MKRCLLILPYFGYFNNYFQLFINSCEMNTSIEWLIYTDDKANIKYPSNVHIKYCSFKEFKNKVDDKMGFHVSLDKPYKLCDIRPAYGYIFEEELQGYDYWGHCDCDLIFGDIQTVLQKLMNENWDKIFAVGHLSIYKNSIENNRIFMNDYKGEKIYKKFMTNSSPCWFDEDWKEINIVTLFLEAGKKIYLKDLSANPYGQLAKFHLRKYIPENRNFITLPYKKGVFCWQDGKIIFYEKKGKKVVNEREYLYLHLQRRTMLCDVGDLDKCYAIIPNKFIAIDKDIAQMPTWDWSMFSQIKKRIIAKIHRGLKKMGGKL